MNKQKELEHLGYQLRKYETKYLEMSEQKKSKRRSLIEDLIICFGKLRNELLLFLNKKGELIYHIQALKIKLKVARYLKICHTSLGKDTEVDKYYKEMKADFATVQKEVGDTAPKELILLKLNVQKWFFQEVAYEFFCNQEYHKAIIKFKEAIEIEEKIRKLPLCNEVSPTFICAIEYELSQCEFELGNIEEARRLFPNSYYGHLKEKDYKGAYKVYKTWYELEEKRRDEMVNNRDNTTDEEVLLSKIKRDIETVQKKI